MTVKRPFRAALHVGSSVFAFSVLSELLCIRFLRGSLTLWLRHPHRFLLLLSMVLVDLLNAVIAVYFTSRAAKAELTLTRMEKKQQEIGLYLNHRLRDALLVIHNAALSTQDEQAIAQCDEAAVRIIEVLVSPECGIPDSSEVLLTSATMGPTAQVSLRREGWP